MAVHKIGDFLDQIISVESPYQKHPVYFAISDLYCVGEAAVRDEHLERVMNAAKYTLPEFQLSTTPKNGEGFTIIKVENYIDAK